MPLTTEEPSVSQETPVLISQYPREESKVRRGVIISLTIHLTVAALICLVTYLLGIQTLKDLLDKGGSIETNGPAPEEPMTVELQIEDITPPPVQNPEFIQEIVKPKVKPPPPVKKPEPKQPDKPQPRYTAPNAKGSGKTDTISKFVLGSSGFPHPGYPAAAKNARQEGTVRVHVTFDASGGADDVTITSSSGVILLDVSTRNFIKGNWHNVTFANQSVDVPIVYSISNLQTSQ